MKFGRLGNVHLPFTIILPRVGFPVSSTFVPSSPASTYVVRPTLEEHDRRRRRYRQTSKNKDEAEEEEEEEEKNAYPYLQQ